MSKFVICAGTKEKPLRLVHRKVLRNWQVNCAMHAWAMPLGERSTEELTIITFLLTPAQRLSDDSFITDITLNYASKRRKYTTIKNVF